MTEKIVQWQGFCTMNCFKKEEGTGEGLHISVTTQGVPRDSAEKAWEDALRFEDEHQKNAKEDAVRISVLRPGICPTGFL